MQTWGEMLWGEKLLKNTLKKSTADKTKTVLINSRIAPEVLQKCSEFIFVNLSLSIQNQVIVQFS